MGKVKLGVPGKTVGRFDSAEGAFYNGKSIALRPV